MEEGNWIEMAGVTLITAKGTVAEGGAAEDTEGGCAEVGHNAEQGAEGDAEQDTETARDEGAGRTSSAEENPASDAKRVVVAEHAALAAGTSPEANAVNTEGAAHAPVEEVNETTRRSSGGDADDKVHAAELEAALLTVSSPGCETHTEDAGPIETGTPSVAAAEAEVLGV
jgi:hypothetical protein